MFRNLIEINKRNLLDSPSIRVLWDSPWLAFSPSLGTLRYLSVAAFKRTSTSGGSRLALGSTRAIMINRQTSNVLVYDRVQQAGRRLLETWNWDRHIGICRRASRTPTCISSLNWQPIVSAHPVQQLQAGRHTQSVQRVRKDSFISNSRLKMEGTVKVIRKNLARCKSKNNFAWTIKIIMWNTQIGC